jgi:hypothetical protein
MKLRILAFSLLINCFWSCTSGRNAAPIELVPADAVIAVSANWQEVCKDNHLKKLANMQAINNLLQLFGIEPSSVAKLVLFSKRLNPKNDDIAMIFNGSYNLQRLLERARSQNFTRQTYQGQEFYCNETTAQALCVLRGGLVSLGARDLVEDTLAVMQSPAKALARQPSIRRMMQTKDRQVSLEVLLAMPQEVEDMNNVALHMSSFLLDLAGIGVIGELLNTIGFARALNCSLVRRGNRFAVELKVAMKDENAASLISGSLNLLKKTSAFIPREQMSADDRMAIEKFNDLKVTRNQEVLAISMSIPEEELIR